MGNHFLTLGAEFALASLAMAWLPKIFLAPLLLLLWLGLPQDTVAQTKPKTGATVVESCKIDLPTFSEELTAVMKYFESLNAQYENWKYNEDTRLNNRRLRRMRRPHIH